MRPQPHSGVHGKLPIFHKAGNNINFHNKNFLRRSYRVYLIPLGLLFVLLLLIGRLFHLTVVKGAYYHSISEDNRIKELIIEGKRGSIVDRNGVALAETKVFPAKNDMSSPKFERVYPFASAVAHVVGYRQATSRENFEQDACANRPSLSDKMGSSGIEKEFECHLRPKKGKKLIETDVFGKFLKTISEVKAESGKNIRLSIDGELQEAAYNAINNNKVLIKTGETSKKKIAVVAEDPRTGEILLLMSYPSFDSLSFEKNDQKVINQIIKDKAKPLYNRATLGTYPPGSVFKPIVAAAGLEEEVIKPTDTIVDNGFITAGPIKFHNWYFTKYGKTDGSVDMIKGLQRSNDIYFYRLGEKLSPEKIKSWAQKFGLGKHSGLELEDAEGTLPSDFWKRETIGDKWYLGDTYNMSIGQGYILTTPLQINRATTVFANGGQLCTPHLLKLDAYENRMIMESNKPDCVSLNLEQETLDTVREGMKRACESGGTAFPFFEFKAHGERIFVGCKTGTAESHGVDKHPHAWFTIFAPFDKPEIVLTVMVENGGEGSENAAPIAKVILEEYFNR